MTSKQDTFSLTRRKQSQRKQFNYEKLGQHLHTWRALATDDCRIIGQYDEKSPISASPERDSALSMRVVPLVVALIVEFADLLRASRRPPEKTSFLEHGFPNDQGQLRST